MESNFEHKYAAIVSAFAIIIFVLTWCKRRQFNLPLEPYYNKKKPATNCISRIVYGFDETSITTLGMKKTSFSDYEIY